MELEELEGFEADELELDGLLLELLDGFEADEDDGLDADDEGFDADEDGFDGLLPSATASNIQAVISNIFIFAFLSLK